MIAAPLNPNRRPNTDVVVPWINGLDIVNRPRNVWIIDFGVNTSQADAALYEQPFEYVRRSVKPERDKVRNDHEKRYWWLHARTAPDMRKAIGALSRFAVTPTLSKHRLFVWFEGPKLPDHQLVVFARDDDYFFGILHSRVHEVWALRQGTSLEDRPRYIPTRCFETFPFPWTPGQEDQSDVRVIAIAHAAKELNELREAWLNPPDASEAELTPGGPPARSAGHGQKRTLTNLYNARPTWLDNAHRKLDAAVFAAYGWPSDLSDDEILSRLLALNLERAASA